MIYQLRWYGLLQIGIGLSYVSWLTQIWTIGDYAALRSLGTFLALSLLVFKDYGENLGLESPYPWSYKIGYLSCWLVSSVLWILVLRVDQLFWLLLLPWSFGSLLSLISFQEQLTWSLLSPTKVLLALLIYPYEIFAGFLVNLDLYLQDLTAKGAWSLFNKRMSIVLGYTEAQNPVIFVPAKWSLIVNSLCAGWQINLSLLILATILGLWFLERESVRWLLIVSVLLLGWLINVLRLFLTGYAAEYLSWSFSLEALQTRWELIHELLGYGLFAVFYGMVGLLCLSLRRYCQRLRA